jgi:hypothetical protein
MLRQTLRPSGGVLRQRHHLVLRVIGQHQSHKDIRVEHVAQLLVALVEVLCTKWFRPYLCSTRGQRLDAQLGGSTLSIIKCHGGFAAV